jgi:hypothetical protein
MDENNAYVLPNVGTKGKFRASAPFDTLINPTLTYTCIKVQNYETAITDGDMDLYERVYEPMSLSEDTLTQHAQLGALLITLVSESDQVVEIPSVYLKAMSNENTVPYVNAIIGVHLGPVEVSEPLGQLKEDIEDLINAHLGVSTVVKLVHCGVPVQVDQTTHQAILKKRTQTQVLLPNKEKVIQSLQTKVNDLQSKVNALVKYIQEHNLVP